MSHRRLARPKLYPDAGRLGRCTRVVARASLADRDRQGRIDNADILADLHLRASARGRQGGAWSSAAPEVIAPATSISRQGDGRAPPNGRAMPAKIDPGWIGRGRGPIKAGLGELDDRVALKRLVSGQGSCNPSPAPPGLGLSRASISGGGTGRAPMSTAIASLPQRNGGPCIAASLPGPKACRPIASGTRGAFALAGRRRKPLAEKAVLPVKSVRGANPCASTMIEMPTLTLLRARKSP